ncbi:hypothetical protein BGZ52_003775 [Haplosporangium bisporale]|nr:hypothetical protein BGZ52_003775 [Haplosporangium bisporale]KFH72311.1 hypothetical protein MVEG_02602 [Podila verticillata NRRL 6337]
MTIENRLPRVEIEFCTGCKWHLRAGWMAQELLLTFNNAIGELALIPGKSAVFIVRVNGEEVYNRKDEGRFPEMKELKQLVRNVIAPEMGLGHSDSAVKSAQANSTPQVDASSTPAPAPPVEQVVVDTPVSALTVKAEDLSLPQNNEHEARGPEQECKTCL